MQIPLVQNIEIYEKLSIFLLAQEQENHKFYLGKPKAGKWVAMLNVKLCILVN